MPNPARLFLLGSLCWGAIAVGHPVIVDVQLTLDVDNVFGFVVRPDADLRAQLAANTLDFGHFGSNTALRAFGGFSLWLPVAALVLCLVDLLVGRSPALDPRLRRRLTWINALAMLGFTGLAFYGFIYPPQIVGTIGSLAFLGSAFGPRP